MKLKVGDDGEIDFIDVEEKPKRKRKPLRLLRGCIQFVTLMLFFILSLVGGFALFFVRNPNAGLNNTSRFSSAPCSGNIKMMSVAGDAVLFQNPVEYPSHTWLLVRMGGSGISMIHGTAESLSLSNDTKHIVESRYEPIAPYFLIYTWVIDKFGQPNEQILTDGKYPSWSPDGRQIAFFRSYGSDRSVLYLMNADGSHIRSLRKTYFVDGPANWSPDGTQLVLSTSNYGETNQNIYILNLADGSEHALIQNGLSSKYPSWSPDGKTIAYVSSDLYTINLDGSNRRNLTNSKFSAIDNVGWSPDSMNIVFLAREAGAKQEIYIMDNDGSGLHSLYQPCL